MYGLGAWNWWSKVLVFDNILAIAKGICFKVQSHFYNPFVIFAKSITEPLLHHFNVIIKWFIFFFNVLLQVVVFGTENEFVNIDFGCELCHVLKVVFVVPQRFFLSVENVTILQSRLPGNKNYVFFVIFPDLIESGN